uniref:Putative capsid n=1 Tax=Barns Ness breadcrumb sponge tombus-like virus 3 TaxID=2021904 RepID=A0A221LFG9_9TOMB|nr:putative capsid [Barns Ness breadcrumb sponge tombus-like virus 3]
MTTQRKKYTTRRPRTTMRRPTYPQKRKAVNKRRPAGNSLVRTLVHGVADPCHGPVTPGIYGSVEGLSARTKSNLTSVGEETTDTCGICIWVPSFHNDGLGGFNLMHMVLPSPSTQLVNSLSSPLGVGSFESASGASIEDPSAGFVKAGICADARTLSACMRLTYTGKVTESAGQIAWIDNYNINDLLTNLPSVNDFFNRATKTERLGLDTYEVLFRPDEATGTDRFRTSGPALATWQQNPDYSDACFDAGVPTGSGTARKTAASATVSTLAPKVIGFAWRGAQPGFVDHLVLEFVKTIEWRPEITAGLTGVIPRSLPVPSTQLMVAALDNADPSWSKRIASGASSLANKAKNSAWQAFKSEGMPVIARLGAQAAYNYLAPGASPMYIEYN